MSDPPPTYVFQDVSADLFQHGSLHVLVYADRLSGWPVVHQWRRDPTAREVVQAVVSNFVELGVPMRFRSDGGPQFSAGIFQEALKRWGGRMGQFVATLSPKQRARGGGGEGGKGVGGKARTVRRLIIGSLPHRPPTVP